MTEYLIYGVEIKIEENTEKGELIECHDYGTELEVKSLDPFKLEEAPQEEDWGE